LRRTNRSSPYLWARATQVGPSISRLIAASQSSKFIHWRGGAESIRQNNLFKDYFLLAEHETAKRKELYVLGTRYPIKFLSSGRSLKSILSKNSKVADEYFAIYGDRFKTVGDYFGFRCDAVAIGDAALLIPELVVKALEVAANSPE